jgi:hypothetical protein
VLCVRGG